MPMPKKEELDKFFKEMENPSPKKEGKGEMCRICKKIIRPSKKETLDMSRFSTSERWFIEKECAQKTLSSLLGIRTTIKSPEQIISILGKYGHSIRRLQNRTRKFEQLTEACEKLAGNPAAYAIKV